MSEQTGHAAPSHPEVSSSMLGSRTHCATLRQRLGPSRRTTTVGPVTMHIRDQVLISPDSAETAYSGVA